MEAVFLLMLDNFFANLTQFYFNLNEVFLSNIHFDNLQTRLSNNQFDKTTGRTTNH